MPVVQSISQHPAQSWRKRTSAILLSIRTDPEANAHLLDWREHAHRFRARAGRAGERGEQATLCCQSIVCSSRIPSARARKKLDESDSGRTDGKTESAAEAALPDQRNGSHQPLSKPHRAMASAERPRGQDPRTGDRSSRQGTTDLFLYVWPSNLSRFGRHSSPWRCPGSSSSCRMTAN